jgi:SNF2 family DNA or RNA helicase
LDPWWNPAVEDQATDRAHRIGQTRPVTSIRFVAKGTVEEAIVGVRERKRELANAVLDGTDVAAKLSQAELLDLVRSGLEA